MINCVSLVHTTRMTDTDKAFQCVHCQRRFTTNGHLTEHIVSQHKNPHSFCCEFCQKRFNVKSALVVHRRTHTKERPFKCSHCDKGFASRTGMDAHVYRHHSVGAFQCTVCRHKFPSSCKLERHLCSALTAETTNAIAAVAPTNVSLHNSSDHNEACLLPPV